MSHQGSNHERSKYYGMLQNMVDSLFEEQEHVRRLDIIMAAETSDFPDDLMELVNLLPPGNFTRQRLCDQLNSSIAGHAWGQVYGTVV